MCLCISLFSVHWDCGMCVCEERCVQECAMGSWEICQRESSAFASHLGHR